MPRTMDTIICTAASMSRGRFSMMVVTMVITASTAAGISCGILTSVLYLIQAHERLPWQVLLFNVQNWLPFAAYLFLGAVGGYSHDKHVEKVEDSKEEYHLLQDKYEFLGGLYRRVLSSNETFNQQIIGYQNSYGKIYKMVKALDVTEPDDVVYAAVSELEDMLDSHSVAIYLRQRNSGFARLAAGSREVFSEVPKSLRISEYEPVVDTLGKGDAFVNRGNVPGMPSSPSMIGAA